MNIPKPMHVEAPPGSIFRFKPGNRSNTDSQDISDNIEDDYDDMYTGEFFQFLSSSHFKFINLNEQTGKEERVTIWNTILPK